MIEAIAQASPTQIRFHREKLERRQRLNPKPLIVEQPIAVTTHRQPVRSLPALQCTSWPEWVIEIAHGGSRQPRRAQTYPHIRDIIEIVAEFYCVRALDILSARRTFEIVRPRQMAACLAKSMTPKSLPEIGRSFGGRDHSTILHAVRKIERLIKNDLQVAEDFNKLRAAITAHMFAHAA